MKARFGQAARRTRLQARVVRAAAACPAAAVPTLAARAPERAAAVAP
eukprot:SAG31_NODE_1465_length_8232_cov_31.250830_6_plen_47_part_00